MFFECEDYLFFSLDVPENQEDKISELNPAPSSSTLTSMEDAKCKIDNKMLLYDYTFTSFLLIPRFQVQYCS